jgi:hypothetical protein
MKVFTMHKLKKGVIMEDYKKWSREVDQKITLAQASIRKFEVYEIKGSEEETSPFDIVEVIEVESWETLKKIENSEKMKRFLAEEWMKKWVDKNSLVNIYGRKI